MVVSTIGIVAIVVWLSMDKIVHQASAESHAARIAAVKPVTPIVVDKAGVIHLASDSRLRQRLKLIEVKPQSVHFAKLDVSGSVIARIRPGAENINERWQFSTSELTDTYADWLRVQSEIEFAERQLQKTTELANAQTKYLRTSYERLAQLKGTGSFPEKNFLEVESELKKSELQGEKDIFAVQSTLRLAIKNRAALERHLSQAGIEPIVLTRAVENMVLVVANVPESRISQVSEGQSCEVTFYGYPDLRFPGHVESLGSTLMQDRRILRVLFDLNDPTEHLKPGMFADVSLGTDAREVILVPTTSLLHIGRNDYIVSESQPGEFNVQLVKLGDNHNGMVEVVTGISTSQRIVEEGVILLKPLVLQAIPSLAIEGT